MIVFGFTWNQPNNRFPSMYFNLQTRIHLNDMQGQIVPLSKQVEMYMNVREELVKEMGSSAATQQQYFSKSIFYLFFCTTDYPNFENLPNFQMKYTSQQYINLMVTSLAQQLKVTKQNLPFLYKKGKKTIFKNITNFITSFKNILTF